MTKKKSIIARLGGQKFIVFLVVVALAAFFSIVGPTFRQYSTLFSILNNSYYFGLMAIGVTFPLITAGVDLSIGTGIVCYALAGGYLITAKHWPVFLGIIVAILFGCAIGAVNGTLIAVMDLPPFLATLCTCMITRGLGSRCSNSQGVKWPSEGLEGGWFHLPFKVTTASEFMIPTGFFTVLILALVMDFVLKHTKMGRYTIAIGSNKEATMLSGINVKFYHAMAYVISGLFAGLASIAYAHTTPTVQPAQGAGLELEAIGGAIIGGVSATGGMGSTLGAFIGLYVICVLKTGLPFIGLQANWNQIVTGIVLIAAVLVDIIKRRREEKI